ncbi:outer membrane beta-barrel protein [Proteiniphilum sp.]|uniref:outer membrane beta-barrel protein n=1 Tax=Proteiniphilum sp. TaxID=1926877 RepID=UPI002B21B5EF|nr:outer membrane beta-barrel protein [Proteiniphilum sp.]MEA4916771.1 hypothetical protein [Proteiniphilum sp.]
MKRSAKFFLIGILFSISHLWQTNLHAQSTFSNSKGAIGITYSGSLDNQAYYFESLEGTAGYNGKGYYSLGITYIHPLTKRLDIETGISYSKYKYQVGSTPPPGQGTPKPYNVTNDVVDIPVTVRWTFLKHFFLNGGLLLGIDTGKENDLDSQTGIGAMIGVGAKYDLKNIPIGFFFNPYFKMHSLLPFSLDNYHQRTDESGFRLGVVYHLP